MKTILIIIAIIIVLLLAIYINHKIHIKKEAESLLLLGQMVDADGHNHPHKDIAILKANLNEEYYPIEQILGGAERKIES